MIPAVSPARAVAGVLGHPRRPPGRQDRRHRACSGGSRCASAREGGARSSRSPTCSRPARSAASASRCRCCWPSSPSPDDAERPRPGDPRRARRIGRSRSSSPAILVSLARAAPPTARRRPAEARMTAAEPTRCARPPRPCARCATAACGRSRSTTATSCRTSSRRAPSSSTPSRTARAPSCAKSSATCSGRCCSTPRSPRATPTTRSTSTTSRAGSPRRWCAGIRTSSRGEVATTPEQVLVLWNAAKAAEKHERTQRARRRAASGCRPSRSRRSSSARRRQVGVRPVAARAPRATPRRPRPNSATPCSRSSRTARAHGWDAERALRERLRALEARDPRGRDRRR